MAKKAEKVKQEKQSSSETKSEIESVLFSSGRNMDIDELKKITGYSTTVIDNAIHELKKDYDSKKTSSIMLVNEGSRWKLAVKEKYIPIVRKVVSQTELSKSVMETLAVIAFKYPILQADVIKIRTNKAYEHLAELEDAGYVTRERYGRTKKIRLTQKFYDYFDIPEEKVKEAFSRFDAVEKSIENQETKNKGLIEDQKKQEEESKKKIDTSIEKIGDLNTYDVIADEIGSEPQNIPDEELEVEIPRARVTNSENEELKKLLKRDSGEPLNVQEELTEESTEESNAEEDSGSETKEIQENDSGTSTENKNIIETNQNEESDINVKELNDDLNLDEESNTKNLDDQLEEEKPSDNNQASDLQTEGDIFGNPELDDEETKKENHESDKLLDEVTEEIEESKNEIYEKKGKNKGI